MKVHKMLRGISYILLITGMVTAQAADVAGKMSNKGSIPANKDSNNAGSSANAQSAELTKVYDNRDGKYLIKYPSEWIYDASKKGVVVFSGKKNTPAYYTTVNIQTVLTKKSGGEYEGVSDLIADIKQQILTESPKTNFVNKGPIVVTTKDGFKLTGESLTFIYTYQGHIIEQWQVAVPRKDKSVIYTWAYTAPIEQYNDALSTAKAMIATWSIYK